MKNLRSLMGAKRFRIAGLALLASILALPMIAEAWSQCPSTISSNFNGTSVPPGRYVWFNSHLTSVSGGDETYPLVICLTEQKITVTTKAGEKTFDVPDAKIIIDPCATEPATTFQFDDFVGEYCWITTIPQKSDEIFMSGFTWQVTPDDPDPKGANPVRWTGNFCSNQSGVTVKWQWGAAVYLNFDLSNDALGVLPIHKTLHAGTPTVFASPRNCVGGARGGGASNFTGSWSATKSITCCQCDECQPPGPEAE